MRATVTQTTPSARRLVAFGITDPKGREIGVSISSAPITVVRDEDSMSSYRGLNEEGDYISVCISPTRNGQEFGACQPSSYYKTQEEADAAIEKRIKSTLARYKKQFA